MSVFKPFLLKSFTSPLISRLTYFLGSLLLILMCGVVNGQPEIEIPGTRKLTVADFKGKPDETANYLAQTTPSISLRYSPASACQEAGKVKIKVETGVSVSEKSWIKIAKLRNSDLLSELLSHEQGHYDMGVIFALDLKKKLSALCFDRNNYRQQADSVFKSMYTRYDAMQREYDIQTEHMRNTKSQLQWKQKIAGMWRDAQ